MKSFCEINSFFSSIIFKLKSPWDHVVCGVWNEVDKDNKINLACVIYEDLLNNGNYCFILKGWFQCQNLLKKILVCRSRNDSISKRLMIISDI
jgi:hypothetical protein